MRHFHRTQLTPATAIAAADVFFPSLALKQTKNEPRSRTYTGDLGSVTVAVKPEGGHYTYVEAHTDQMGESRLDRNVKRFFVELHRQSDPSHALEAAY
jgi:hypothetical protein